MGVHLDDFIRLDTQGHFRKNILIQTVMDYSGGYSGF